MLLVNFVILLLASNTYAIFTAKSEILLDDRNSSRIRGIRNRNTSFVLGGMFPVHLARMPSQGMRNEQKRCDTMTSHALRGIGMQSITADSVSRHLFLYGFSSVSRCCPLDSLGRHGMCA